MKKLFEREIVGQEDIDKNNYFFLTLVLKFLLSMVAGFQEETRHGTLLLPYTVVAGVLSCCLHVGGNIFFYKITAACGA